LRYRVPADRLQALKYQWSDAMLLGELQKCLPVQVIVDDLSDTSGVGSRSRTVQEESEFLWGHSASMRSVIGGRHDEQR
jgi:hypothetical protein